MWGILGSLLGVGVGAAIYSLVAPEPLDTIGVHGPLDYASRASRMLDAKGIGNNVIDLGDGKAVVMVKKSDSKSEEFVGVVKDVVAWWMSLEKKAL